MIQARSNFKCYSLFPVSLTKSKERTTTIYYDFTDKTVKQCLPVSSNIRVCLKFVRLVQVVQSKNFPLSIINLLCTCT